MRQDSTAFLAGNTASSKEPRFVVGILFDVGSIYLTSHDDITGVPGTVINGILEDVSALSQRLVPDQGRSEIGSMSIRALDRLGTLTTEFRSKLTSLKGLRGRTVKLWHGFKGFTFAELQLFQTQILRSVEVDGALYSIECSDITRSQREQIFEPKATNLRVSVTATDEVLFVADTSAFVAVAHGASYSDAPNQTVGYIKLEDEIIRWTGKTADSFTGCTRGVLNTRAKAHAVNANATVDRRTRIEEVVYLEEPAIRLAYAVLTGVLYGTANTLPDHWHLGISTALVRTADWTGIGKDLWDTADSTKGLVLRFLRPKKQDGKTFLEKEIFLLGGVFQRTYADGMLGLKRMAALVRDSAPLRTLNETDVVSVGALTHDMPSLHNQFLVEWGWDGADFRRKSLWVDLNSVAVHGESEEFALKFTGLAGARHTGTTIRQRLTQLADRYSAPPERISVQVLGALNNLEVGDVVRLKVANLRDFAGSSSTIDRSFEVQRVSVNYVTGAVDLDLFGSTAKPTEVPLDEATTVMADGWYTAQGTNLSSVMTIDGGGNVTGGPYTLAGGTDITAAGSTWYYAGDLTIGAGVTVNITGNVQLRIRGFLTVNGSIDGVGYGHVGVTDSGSATVFPDGVAGYVGNSRGRDGQNISQESGNPIMNTIPAKVTVGTHAVFPYLSLTVADDRLSIAGLPTDLRGTGGAPGGKVTYQESTQRAAGGSGGTGGAGLLIACRGLGFGVSGEIDLSGASGFAGTRYDAEGKGWNPGPGGAGGPGAFLCLLDGDTVPLPDITGKFFALTGTVPTVSPYEGKLKYLEQRGSQRYNLSERNFAGFDDPSVISGADLSDAASRLQYIPYPISAVDDVDEPPPVPTNVSATPGPGYNLISWVTQSVPNSAVEIWASIDNALANASKVGEAQGSQFYHALLNQQTYWYFLRTRVLLNENTDVFSSWTESPTGTLYATALASAATDIPEEDDFLERFEGQDAETRYVTEVGSGSITYPLNGSFGGRVLRVSGGMRAMVYLRNLPLAPGGKYRMTARLRQVTAPTSSTADGVTPIFSGGIDHYPCALNLDLGSAPLGSWVTVIGYFIGASTAVLSPAPDIDNPSGVAAGAAYIRPVITLNYFNGDGVQEVDYVRIERLIAGHWFDITGEGRPSDYADNTAENAALYTGVWFDPFEHEAIQRFYNNWGALWNPAITYPAVGEDGGTALQVIGQFWAGWKTNIPYDPTALYKMTLRIRRVQASTTGAGTVFLYCGVEGLAADGETWINPSGFNDPAIYGIVCNGVDFNTATLNQWQTYIGYFGGHSGTPNFTNALDNPTRLYTGVRYFRPALLCNYPAGNAIVQIDSIKIERLTRVATGLLEQNAVTETFAAEDTGAYQYATSGGLPTREERLCGVTFTPDIDAEVAVICTYEIKTDTAGAGNVQAILRQNGVNVSVATLNRPYTAMTQGTSTLVASVTKGLQYTAYLNMKISTQPVTIDIARMQTVVQLLRR